MNKEQRDRFAAIFRKWMEDNKLSQRGAGRVLDVSQSAIASWSKGQNAINMEDFERFAVIIGKTPEALLAEVRGVALEQMPADLPLQDIERICTELPVEEQTKLIHTLIENIKGASPPKENGKGKKVGNGAR